MLCSVWGGAEFELACDRLSSLDARGAKLDINTM
jgi:hypothetical protein